MKRTIITTGDGSKTIHIPEWNEQYHSKHGAIQEARHVFLETGLQHFLNENPERKSVSILEMGFGTGLNALLTYFKTKDLGISINYTGVEAFPVSPEEAMAMEYASQLDRPIAPEIYRKMHEIPFGNRESVSDTFQLEKRQQKFEDIEDMGVFDLVYFDAFGPRVQPDLWTEFIFKKMFTALKSDGVLTTYCAQGAARRAMQAVGFEVERLPGPPGKREMLRATKV
ncbi:SAM-dependent methyltransferase [Dokdonia sinensis]|uniref:SAM-dependent methyltransferase n=1 Tax=Dokdonia sinensis TaxID=2479847 RepID=A0A3M0FUS6_9FLAO|nr:tRNA (5-methylaminomethyl-2-thiouridine)(34)-methyltransferase MnmD [Dokdonia sinensis]RMB56258.1 SAM-dependent methyltransferase [Dokdonia sinensis]